MHDPPTPFPSGEDGRTAATLPRFAFLAADQCPFFSSPMRPPSCVVLLAFLCCGAHALIAPVGHTLAVTRPRSVSCHMSPVAEQGTRKAPRVPGTRVVQFTGKATGQAVRATGKATGQAVRATGKATGQAVRVAARIVRPVVRPFARNKRTATVEMEANRRPIQDEQQVKDGANPEASAPLLQTRVDYGEVASLERSTPRHRSQSALPYGNTMISLTRTRFAPSLVLNSIAVL